MNNLFDKGSLLTIDDILSLPETEEAWLVQSIVLYQAITIISGLPNHFKSFFVQMLVKAVASGTPFLGRFKTNQGAVLVIDRELPTQRLHRRWKTIGDLHGLPIYFYPYADSFKLDNKKDAERLKELVIKYDIKLVVIDTFNRSHSGKEINSSSEVGQIFEPLKAILEYASIILTHHSNKSGYSREEPTSEELLGSIDFSAQTDLHFTIRKSDKNTLTAYNLKSKDSEIINPFVLNFTSYPDGTVDLLYEGEKQGGDTPVEKREQIILDFLKTGKKSKSELLAYTAALGHAEGTINNTLTFLRKRKVIESEIISKEAYYFLLEEQRIQPNGHFPLPNNIGTGSEETSL